jgi:hypothetical protein
LDLQVPFEIFLSPVQQQTVNDWLSPDFHQSEAVPLILLVFQPFTCGDGPAGHLSCAVLLA